MARYRLPLGTLVVNITGSFLIGLLLPLLATHILGDPTWRPFLIVGLIGGYTTFSAFSAEVVALIQQGRGGAAALYVGLSVGASLVACFGGVRVATLIGR